MAKKMIAVFEPKNLEHLGIISKYTSISFTKESKSTGSFELWCDINDNNVELLKHGNLIYLDKDKVGIVQYSQEQVSDKDVKSLDVKGKTIKFYMSYRIIMGTYEALNKHVSDVMTEMIVNNFITPSDDNRKFDNLIISNTSEVGTGNVVSFQQTGGEVMGILDTMCDSYGFCYDIILNVDTKKLEFKVYKGVDRTQHQNNVYPVVVTTDLNDVLNSKYIKNSSDEKNIALVAGAGEGADRKVLIVGDSDKVGVDRKEMYVDARDISLNGEESTSTILSDEEYNLLLANRGESKLSEQKVLESFDASIRTIGHTNYVYGVDYFLGDTITAIDKKLGVTVDAEVTAVEEVYSGTDGYSLNITFGYSQPTIMNKVKSITSASSSSGVGGVSKSELSDAKNEVLEQANNYTDTSVSGKAPASHTHDDRYYTETEINAKLLKFSGTASTGNMSGYGGSTYTGKKLTFTLPTTPTSVHFLPVATNWCTIQSCGLSVSGKTVTATLALDCTVSTSYMNASGLIMYT